MKQGNRGAGGQSDSFEVPTPFYAMMWASDALAPLLVRMSQLETFAHRGALGSIPVDRPVFVTGMARAGTTITLEMLSRHPQVGTHRYTDFVVPYLPIWWQRILPRLPFRGLEQPVERIHKDRIRVTQESPEAIEEMVWVRFFPHLHDPERVSVLGADTSNPSFERFYAEHIRKLLLVRGRQRYVAKNNYLATRLGYLVRALPSARVFLLVRNPISHIASLAKQHRIFRDLAAAEPRQLLLTRVAAHFEFGPHRVSTNVGNPERQREIEACWQDGREVRGWALHWASLYEFLHAELERDEEVRRACSIVRYEDLCDAPRAIISRMLEHAELPADRFTRVLDEYAGKLSRPSYYRPDFSDAELGEIEECAGPTAAKFGYFDLRASV